MERQLVLLETTPDWRLDEATKVAGREGIAAARACLQEARRRAAAARAAAGSPRHPSAA